VPPPAVIKSAPAPTVPVKVEEFNLPDWIDGKVWDAFIDMRKRAKAVPTIHAKNLLVNQLSKLKQSGDEPNKVLEQSIMNNWKGLFALKKEGNNGTVSKGNPRTLIQRTEYTRPS
jgi:hypothetical protein